MGNPYSSNVAKTMAMLESAALNPSNAQEKFPRDKCGKRGGGASVTAGGVAVGRRVLLDAYAGADQSAAARLAVRSRNLGRTPGPRWGRKDERGASAREQNTAE